jgi:invasion protein IalB
MSHMPVENSPGGLRGHMPALVLGGLGCFVLGAITAALGLHFWQAAYDFRGTVATTAYIQDWRLTCPPKTVTSTACALQQSIVERGTNVTIADISVARGVAADTLTIVVPLGVLVGPGLAFSAGTSATLAVPFTTCAQSGCIAITTLTPNQLSQMESAAGGQITIVGRDGRPVNLSYSLKGFADAMRERDRDWRRRTDHWF